MIDVDQLSVTRGGRAVLDDIAFSRLIADGSPAELRQRSGRSRMNDVFIHFAGGEPAEEVSR